MKLRCPAVPLVTHTPYFSLWSPDDVPNRTPTCHWTGSPQPLNGVLRVGERQYGFLGATGLPPMKTLSVDVTACSTEYVLESPEARLTVRFTSPLLLEDLEVLSRPATYISTKVEGRYGQLSDVSVAITADEAFCLDRPGQGPVVSGTVTGRCYTAAVLKNSVQEPLNRAGDDVRIDWGTLYLAVEKGKAACQTGETTFLKAEAEGKEALFVLAYDEDKAVEYFGKALDPLWKSYYPTMEKLLEEAFTRHAEIEERCERFSDALKEAAVESGGEQYAELLLLAYRQTVAAHCLCKDEDGKLLFISKECFSNGCAATVDISYPSMPLYLLEQPECVFGMMRPIMRYAASPAWPYGFAPHDAGTFPLLNGQVYSGGTDPERQMPVEECGNMLLMTAAATVASDDNRFAAEHWELLTKWAVYLKEKGMDPDNQLCTDDFAGHLAHNCNLSIKAVLGVAAYGLLKNRRGENGEEWLACAREMAAVWIDRAANGDGTYRLAFDQPGTFSMKYNAVWDRILGLNIFPAGTWEKELASYLKRANPYGTPLDNRAGYTKSDWLVWAASMMPDKKDFEAMISPLWAAYNEMPQRVPLTDWYETENAWQVIYSRDRGWQGGGFQNRAVQGGLYVRLLLDKMMK